MAEISAYPWAAADFACGQHANCSLVVVQQTMGSQFPCQILVGIKRAMGGAFFAAGGFDQETYVKFCREAIFLF